MPTYDFDSLFINEYKHLPPDRQALFLDAVRMLVTDLKAGGPIRSSLRVKPVQGYKQIFEMTWEMHNGRATLSYGTPRRPGDVHIHRRRIGDHSILKQP